MATTRKIESAEWNAHQLEIEALFLKQNKTVEQLRQSMKDTHGFLASTAQYIRKLKQWGFEKNTTSDNWRYIAHEVQKRKMAGKESDAFIKGKMVPHKKIKREISRYDLPTYAKRPLVDNFRIVAAQNFNEPYSTPLRYPSVRFSEQQNLHSRDLNTLHTNPTSTVMASLFESTDGSPLRTQIHPGQHVDPRIFSNSSVDGDIPSALSSDIFSQQAQRLLADCLGVMIEPEDTDFASQISDCLDNTMIEANCGNIKTSISKFWEMSKIDASIEFVRYSIYLSSNNLLSNTQTDRFLEWVLQNELFWILQGLLTLKIPTVELLASNLLLSAIRQDEFSIAHTILATGVDVNAEAGEHPSQRALLVAIDKPVEKQDIKLLEQLLDSGADPNAGDSFSREPPIFFAKDRRSAITLAIDRGSSIELVSKLVEAGANPDRALYNGHLLAKLLNQALANKDFQLLRLLLEKQTAAIESTTIRETMLKKISHSDGIGLIQAVFELRRVPTNSVHPTENETDDEEFDRDHLFEVLIEECSNPELDMLLVEARGVYCNRFSAPGSEDMHYLPRDPEMISPALHRAVENNEILHARVLLCAGALPDAQSLDSDTALQRAALKGHTRLAKLLLESGADVNAPPGGEIRNTALQAAVESDWIDIIKLLLDAEADVNAPPYGVSGRTALHVAVECGYIDTVRLLIDEGADVNAPSCEDWGRTALQAAAYNGYIDIIRLLLDTGAEVNAHAGRNNGRTALQAAAEHANIDTVRVLLDAGADVNAPAAENNGQTALQAAVKSNNTDIIRLISDAGTEPNAPVRNIYGSTALQAAVEMHRSKAVAILLNAEASIDATPSEADGISTLHAASRCKDKYCGLLQKVLWEGSHLFNSRGQQALLEWAVHHDAMDLVKLLLECGTDPNTPGIGVFESALYEAVGAKNCRIAAVLMSSGADPNKFKGRWWCKEPLRLAIGGGDVDMINLLIAKGATLSYLHSVDDHIWKEKRFSFLKLAISRRDSSIEIIQALIDSGANVGGEGPHESTPLQKACGLGKLELVKILLHNGASLNAPPFRSGGSTALQAAVEAQNLQLVRLLLQNGADVNAPAAEIRGATALQRAAIVGHLRITLVLLEAGADINAPGASQEGRMALDAAAEHGRLDILHLLLKNDTEKDTLAARCEQAAKLAAKNGRFVIARILRGYVQA